MNLEHELELDLTRRQLFGRAALGVGMAALASLVHADGSFSPREGKKAKGLPGLPHFPPKAKHVIYLTMNGGPSQLDLFDYKPKLDDKFNTDFPEEIRRGQRLTTMTSGQQRFPIAPTRYKFQKYDNNEDGLWVSELLPHTATIAKEMCVVKSMYTEAINHDPACTYIQTGSQLPGRPSIGSWVSYGLGNETENLPTYVVLHSKWSSKADAQALFTRLWGSGFLPSQHQGVAMNSKGDPVLFLKNPEGLDAVSRREMLNTLGELNKLQLLQFADPEIATRISQYEMAYRLQSSVPDLMDLSKESQSTFDLYGEDAKVPGTFAANCLLARRLVERGTRFIQIFHRGWDQHGNLTSELPLQCKDIDQACAALVKDLKQRGLLEDTLVVWGGEFGRTVYCQGALSRANYGRDHHPRCFTMWMAGGGVKPGITYGQTDDYGYNIVDKSGAPLNPTPDEFTPGAVHIHDLNATILHLLGIDHTRLTYKYQGRDFRLTDVHGFVVKDILA
jgi:hypothetical protein